MLDSKIKVNKLVSESDFSQFIQNTDLDGKINKNGQQKQNQKLSKRIGDNERISVWRSKGLSGESIKPRTLYNTLVLFQH